MRIDGRQAQMLSESESFKLLNTLRSQPAFCFHDDANNDEQNNDVAPGESYPLLSPAYINPPRSPFSSITTSLSSTRIQPPQTFHPSPNQSSPCPTPETSLAATASFYLICYSDSVVADRDFTEANLNNPRTSEEAKEHSRQVLDEMESSGVTTQDNRDELKNEGNVIGGHKVNL